MNLRLYSIALLISALPNFALADTKVSLNRQDFVAAERVSPDGETIVKVKLSKSGKAKFKKLNQQSVDKEVHSEIAGVTTDFKLRQPIKGDGLEMGPYSSADADRVVTEINKR
jgi:hypothetical protein